MNYLTLEHVNKMYGDKLLFKDLSLQIEMGQKVALVAENGTGKSTLLRVIAGEEAAEGERKKILVRKDIRIGFLPQDPEFTKGHNIMDAIFAMDHPKVQAIRKYNDALLFPDKVNELEKATAAMDEMNLWDEEAKIKEILSKLNIKNLEQQVETLSGGQKKRLALAKLIIEEPEFVIMDEPTNHLDIDMIEWLETWLTQPKLTIFMVTHDRYFLERVCNTILELDGGLLYKYKGNYSEFLEKKAMREDVNARTTDREKKLLKRELQWVRRQPKARGTKAKSRVDSFHELDDKLSEKKSKDKLQIEIKGSRLGSKILEAHYLCKAYGDLTLVKDFNYKFRKNERVGIVGPNGAGKSTFLKLLTKEIRPDTGKVVVGGTVVFGHFSQDGIQLEEDKRVVDVIRDIAEYIPLANGMKLSAPALLERFLFSRKQQQVYTSQLSGGEKRRLYLLTVLVRNPNFLILDEPTNDLDIVTLNILEDFLMEFPGCILIVSHDRYFMDKLVEHIFVFEEDGRIRDFNGTYSEYRLVRKKEERERKANQETSKEKVKYRNDDKPKLSYNDRREMNKLEKEIGKLETKRTEILEKFNGENLSSDDITKFSIELKELQTKLDAKEMRWMELAELEG